MITYSLLQQYWWLLVSLLGALVVFLMFVQGANTQIFNLGRTEDERALIVNSTGRKWEFTFTTLVTFGGAFFASFPLFYSTSFGGAYWVWMLILFSFVLQAVSYEFQSKLGNFLGKNTYRWFLVLNGVLGPLLLGTAVGTFFHGANFVVNKDVMADQLAPAISSWTTAWHGLGFAVNPTTGAVSLEAYKYLHNFLALPLTLVLFLLGVVLVLVGIGRTIFTTTRRGIWCAGIGSVFTVWALLQVAALNNTAYYPSLADLQSSLTLANSCSSEFTLTAMSFVSLVIPFVLAYIAYAWYSIDRKSLTQTELADNEHKY